MTKGTPYGSPHGGRRVHKDKAPDAKVTSNPPTPLTSIVRFGLNKFARTNLQLLQLIGAPAIVLRLVFFVSITPGIDLTPRLDSLETFAGQQAYSIVKRSHGYSALAYEKDYDPVNMNILTDPGFANLIYFALIMKIGSQAVHAIVCSSWGVINRGTSKRSKGNPLGDTKVSSVREGNVMAARLCIILYINIARAVFFLVENPVNSLLEWSPRMQELAKKFELLRTTIQQGNFGAFSQKPTWLYTLDDAVDSIDDYEDPNRDKLSLARKYESRDGRTSFAGTEHLKSSQAYTAKFGHALHMCWKANRQKIYIQALEHHAKSTQIEPNFERIFAPLRGKDRWRDAELDGVSQYLMCGR